MGTTILLLTEAYNPLNGGELSHLLPCKERPQRYWWPDPRFAPSAVMQGADVSGIPSCQLLGLYYHFISVIHY